MRPTSYQRLSIIEKRALDVSRVREQPIACPECGVGVMPEELLAHLGKRCEGQKAPGPRAKWVTWPEARALGVPRQTLARWVAHGFVRFVGEPQSRKYLLRDLVIRIAQRNGFRRR